VVLAGGSTDDPLAQRYSVAVKALVPFEEKPMVQHVLESLNKSNSIVEVLYLGEVVEALEPFIQHRDHAEASFVGSLSRGIKLALSLGAKRILIVTADIPWITSTAIDDFCKNNPDADLIYPINTKEQSLKEFPSQKRTYARLREGQFTGGNMILLSPKIAETLLPFVERFYQNRKNPFALASFVGFDILFKLLFGFLSLESVEKRISRRLNGTVKAYISPYASIGADVDKPEHLETDLRLKIED